MDNINFKLPKMYEKFLEEIKGSEGFSVGDTGVILYEEKDLEERNLTYEVFEYEPEFFMIGQDGDMAFFIKKDSDDTIYKNDLGALGSFEMEEFSSDIYEFIEYVKEHYDMLWLYKDETWTNF